MNKKNKKNNGAFMHFLRHNWLLILLALACGVATVLLIGFVSTL